MSNTFRAHYLFAALVSLAFLLLPAASQAGQKVYLTSCCGNGGATVSVLDAMMDMEMGFIPAQKGTTAIAMAPDNMTAFIGLSANGSNQVEAVDVMMGTVMMTFPAGNGAAAIAIAPDESAGYIANQNDGSVTIFEPMTGNILGNISVLPGGACLDAAVAPDSSKAYVVCQINPKGKDSQSMLAVISNHQLQHSIALPGTKPFPGNTVLAMSPDGTRAYIAGISTATQTGYAAVNLTKQRVLNFFPLPDMSYGLAVDPMYPQVLFSSGKGVLHYIDAATGTINGTTSLRSSGKGGLVPYMDGMRIAVASVDDDLVAVIDNTDGQLTAQIPTGAAPRRLVVSDDMMTSLAGTTYTTLVHIFDAKTGSWISDFEGGSAPGGVLFSPDGTRAYVVDQGRAEDSGKGSGLSTIDLTMMNERLWKTAIPGASNAVISPDGKAIYVGTSKGSVAAVNPQRGSVRYKVALGSIAGYPGLAVSPDNQKVYASYTLKSGGSALAVIDPATRKITNTISLDSGSSSASPFVALSPDGTRAYVTLSEQNEVAVVDLTKQQLLAMANLGANVNPICIAIHPAGMTAYVVANTGIVVLDLRTNTASGTIPISGSPMNVAFTADGKMAYASVMNGAAAVIDTAIQRVIQQLPVQNTLGVAISAQ